MTDKPPEQAPQIVHLLVWVIGLTVWVGGPIGLAILDVYPAWVVVLLAVVAGMLLGTEWWMTRLAGRDDRRSRMVKTIQLVMLVVFLTAIAFLCTLFFGR